MKKVTSIKHEGRKIYTVWTATQDNLECKFERIATVESGAKNAELIKDAIETKNNCGMNPSELLEFNRQAIKIISSMIDPLTGMVDDTISKIIDANLSSYIEKHVFGNKEEFNNPVDWLFFYENEDEPAFKISSETALGAYWTARTAYGPHVEETRYVKSSD